MYRQGDVLLVPTSDVMPIGTPEVPQDGRLVLVRGEATGHHHSIDADHACYYATPESDGAMGLLDVVTETELRHQEHGAIPLPVGRYRVVRQREYWSEGGRWVAD